MQVKIFRANNMQEALRKVKQAFGPNALILSTRTVRKGRLGFLRAPELEITAARELTNLQAHAKKGNSFEQEFQTQVNGTSERLELTYDGNGRLDSSPKRHAGLEISGSAMAKGSEIRELQTEVRALRKLLLSNGVGGKGQVLENSQPEVQFFLERGIYPDAAQAIVSNTKGMMEQDDPGQACLSAWCEECLAKWVQVNNGIDEKGKSANKIVFLGPTGVGKTTTMAKLAAHYLQHHGGNLLLVTIDNYRIAAAEQLRVYAEIMNLPLEVVSSPGQLHTVLRRQGVNKLTLIDTAGRNPLDAQGLQELQDFFGQGQSFDKYLVMSSTTREENLQGIVECFSPLGLNGLVFTKLDESRHYASLVNMQYRTGYPLTYLTNGQRVPQDFCLADAEHISRLIINPEENVLYDE